MRLLGFTSFSIGIAIITWVACKLVVARQPEFTGVRSAVQLVLPALLILLGWRWLKSPLAGNRDHEAP